ncbi:hypothetical protein AAE478_009777 [Parahypoxylon ruwenzoriense]
MPERPLQLPQRVEFGETVQAPRASALPPRFSLELDPASRSQSRASTPSMTARAQHRFPTVANGGSWATTPLDAAQLSELFSAIHDTLSHVPYAICGLSALADHGFTGRRVSRGVSLLCPAHSKNNVRAWLAAKGYDTAHADSVAIPIRAKPTDGKKSAQMELRRVRIKYIDEGFEKLDRVRSQTSDAWVLSLTSQLDQVAAGFVEHHRKLQGLPRAPRAGARGESSRERRERESADAEREKAERALATVASDIFWCLDRAARTRQPLNPRGLPTLLGEEFWTPFTRRYGARARPDMARAGIDVAAVLARHRAEAVVREHEAMLREYGVGVGNGGSESGRGGAAAVVTEQPAPFEGMRTLGNRKSVYTLREGRESAAFLGSNVPPTPTVVPPVPSPAKRWPFLRGQQQQQQKQDDGEEEQQQQLPESEETRAEDEHTKRLMAGLSPRKQNGFPLHESSARFLPTSDYGRSLTRTHSQQQPPRPRVTAPVPRFSADIIRPPTEWI